MSQIHSLSDFITVNENFKSSVNLFLHLNKSDKIRNYIPTKTTAELMKNYINSALYGNERATLLVGSYGKGKSYFLLTLLAVLTMDRTTSNTELINDLANKYRKLDEVGEETANLIEHAWEKSGRFLPILVTDLKGDLNQSLLVALSNALKRDSLDNLVPDTYFSAACNRIDDWKEDYPETYALFVEELKKYQVTPIELKAGLLRYSKETIDIFAEIYPRITAGSDFNPLTVSEVLPLYKSISDKLADEYGYSGIYIVFDEFSKFIENQDGSYTGNNMKLIQDLSELANESDSSHVLFTMVAHKSIKEYGRYLSQEIINSYTGIEGRVVEKLFTTSVKNNYELIRSAIIKDDFDLELVPQSEKYFGKAALDNFYSIPAFKSNFEVSDFENIVLRGCYPLSPVAAYLLLNISEKVAQNERTLFSFISNNEPNSMARYLYSHSYNMPWIISADLIYDYFSPLFRKDINNEYIHNQWLNAEYALTKCSNDLERTVVKALAIILIVNQQQEISASEKYLHLASDVDDCANVVQGLIDKQLIYKRGSTNTYAFKTRAGSELRAEIKKEKALRNGVSDLNSVLKQITDSQFIVPRKYNGVHLMTRYFKHEFMNVEDFLAIGSESALLDSCNGADGLAITLYGTHDIDKQAVKKHMKTVASSRIVILCPEKRISTFEQIEEYEILQDIQNNKVFIDNNEILEKEIPLLAEDLIEEINKSLDEIYSDDPNCEVFSFSSGEITQRSRKELEQAVSDVCESVYHKSPTINNEIVNRRVISTGATKRSRIKIIDAILNHEDEEAFYSGTGQEATVYRSLFCKTQLKEGKEEPALNEVIAIINSYIDSCSDRKGSFKELIDALTDPPYGMRLGIIPFYLAYVLSQRHEDLILYRQKKEIEITAEAVVDICVSSDQYALYVSKEDVQKEKYISTLNILFNVRDNRNLTDNRIKDIIICMQRWFRALPQAARNITKNSDYNVDESLLRNMTALKRELQSVEYNPFETLFITLPNEFGTNDNLESTYLVIDECKTAYDDYYDWLIQQLVTSIYDAFGGRRKTGLFHLFKEWYERQSVLSKKGLHNGRVTNLMSTIEMLDVFDDEEISKKIARAVTDTFVENWTDGSLALFKTAFSETKAEVESIHEESSSGKMKLSFVNRSGNEIEKYYDFVDEGTGSILRNIIEDALEEYDDLSVNDRVGILLEMIEKIIK